MYLKYFWYVLRHRWFVFWACCYRGVPWRGLMHDLSKFRPSEFIPYSQYFYGCTCGEQPPEVQAAFDKAWLLHQHRNAHHWQFWVLREDDGDTKRLEMPMTYLTEMVADWVGAGRAITGRYGGTRAWVEKNQNNIMLNSGLWPQIELELILHEGL